MSWERDPLWAKARLFFERAFEESGEEPLFGLWCSLGLELLARAAVASVSPTLLAEPDSAHRFLLQALNRGQEKGPRKSIGTAQVLSLCQTLFPQFSEENRVAALALINRRNDELHTGSDAFQEYPSKVWLAGFYRTCRSLAEAMSETLESLFGDENAKMAKEILAEDQAQVKNRVLSLISAHQKVFLQKTTEEQQVASEAAKTAGEQLSHKRHHRVTCPSCKSVATVQGQPFGPVNVTHSDGSIFVQRAVSPQSFACPACGLNLEGYAELDVAQLGGQYTRTSEYSPEDYFGLVDPNSIDPSEYVEAYLADLKAEAEWDNE